MKNSAAKEENFEKFYPKRIKKNENQSLFTPKKKYQVSKITGNDI